MHFSNDYRAAFNECVLDQLDAADVGQATPMAFADICEVLATCSDVMPAAVCGELDLPPGSTYADGANALI